MTTISSPTERPLVLTKPLFPTLLKIAGQLWAIVAPRSCVEAPTQDAIEILRDGSASPDRRDWAERYLCGMVGADGKRQGERGRGQS